jgi:hypothetical protein
MANPDQVTATPPPSNGGGKRKRRGLAVESDSPFKVAQDPEQRLALRAYLFSLWGLLPPLGLVLGPAAIALALWVRWQHRNNPTFKGKNLVIAALILGSLLTLTTWGGLALMIAGLNEW